MMRKSFVQYILSNDTNNLTDSKALYTALCNEEGGIIDDLVTYKLADDNYLLVVNAANTDKDFKWIEKHAKSFDVEVKNVSEQYGQLALQGPKARDLMQKLVDIDISEMGMFEFKKMFNYSIIMLFFLNLVTLAKMALKFIVMPMIQQLSGKDYQNMT